MRFILLLLTLWCTHPKAQSAESVFEVLNPNSCGSIKQSELKACVCGASDGFSEALNEHIQVVMHPIQSVAAFVSFFKNIRANLTEISNVWAAYSKEYPSLTQVQLRAVNCHFISHLALTGVPVVAIFKNSIRMATRQMSPHDSFGKELAQDLPFDFFVETAIHGAHDESSSPMVFTEMKNIYGWQR